MKNMMQRLKNEKGISLVEILVTLFIFTLISSGIFSIVTVANDSWEVNRVSVELQQELRKAMDWMMNDLREAGPASIIDVPADGNWYTSITFSTPSGVTGGNLTWDSNSIALALGGTGGTQIIRSYGLTTQTLASNITSLQFRRQATSSNILEVSLQAQLAVPGAVTLQRDLDFDVQLRN